MVLHTIPTPAGQIDVEDSCVVAVRRTAGTVVISFDSARLCIDQKSSDTGPLSVAILGVSGEHAVFYGPDEVALSVAGDEAPLSVVEVLEYSDGIVELQGMREGKPWCVWRIEGASARLNWDGATHVAI